VDLIILKFIGLEYFLYQVMEIYHLKKAIIKENYIKRVKEKVANATPTNSLGFFKTPTNYTEPLTN
jgi:hypothetical protein